MSNSNFEAPEPTPENAPVVPATGARDRALVAPLWHTIALVAFLFASVAWQGYKLHAFGPRPFVVAHRVPMYLATIAFEWALFGFVWLFGLRPTHTPVRSIIGGRWHGFGDVMKDIGIAFIFWVAVAGLLIICRLALGANPTAERAVRALLPQTLVETLLWVALALSAGICEEFVFRGYFQRQFYALTGSDAAAVALQAIVFGAAHAYQGYRGVITITLYGVFFGILVILRRSLRPGMIQHFLQDASVVLLRFAPKH
ncbi:MAG: type II CAAX endopeptidase family protein [Candidatus Acidiferrales bacterium]